MNAVILTDNYATPAHIIQRNETMETATGPGAESAHVNVFWPMKSCRQMSPRDRSENNEKVIFTLQWK